MTGTKVEAIHHHGVRVRRGLRRRPRARRAGAPRRRPPAGLHGRPRRATASAGDDRLRRAERRRGQTVAVARPGAVMPDGTKLKQAKLRGVVSEGMILAENELEIGAGRRGDHGARRARRSTRSSRPGTPLAERAADRRPRCSSSRSRRTGRTASASTASRASCTRRRGAPLSPRAVAARTRARRARVDGAQVIVECPDLCPRFTARVFEDVTIAPSPPWLKARLMAAGQRPINNVVDITNYAMLLTGQPLHAFDLDRVAGAHADGAPRARRRAGGDARRADAHARRARWS